MKPTEAVDKVTKTCEKVFGMSPDFHVEYDQLVMVGHLEQTVPICFDLQEIPSQSADQALEDLVRRRLIRGLLNMRDCIEDKVDKLRG